MRLYQSGTPKNDLHQVIENKMCEHRLFSMHGSYEKAILEWVQNVKDSVFTLEAFLEKYPQYRAHAENGDTGRRERQSALGDERDWNTLHALKACESAPAFSGKGEYPRNIMIDSGAFTAWNKGEEVTLDEILRKYENFLTVTDGLFDEVWMVNLDKIPAEKGRDPTDAELTDAMHESDHNLSVLTRAFGDRILPVFHQGEPDARLQDVMDQADYICVSPRNDLPEGKRLEWADQCHKMIDGKVKTHGLATTGNKMIRTVPWTSGDSAAWVHHSGFGMVDIFYKPGIIQGRADGHYTNYFIALEQMGRDDTYGEVVYGMVEVKHKYYERCSNNVKAYIRRVIEEDYGFPFEMAQWVHRTRALICQGELSRFADWATPKPSTVQTLFGAF